MPSSRPATIPTICRWLQKKSTKDISSVLDIGCGFGKWGFLARLYIQIWTKDITKDEYQNWRNNLRVDAIEIFEDYITNLQRLIYNNIYIGDMRKIIQEVGNYDLIIIGATLEHISYEDGLELLKTMRKKSKWTIITTPDNFCRTKSTKENPYEAHQYIWNDTDFPGKPRIKHTGSQKIILYENKKKWWKPNKKFF